MKKIKGVKGSLKDMKTLERNLVSQINTKPEWNQLCEECFFAVQKNGWTKEKSRELLKQVRKEIRENETY